jgi:hypothetical protein
MESRSIFVSFVAASFLAAATVATAKPPANWDGLVQVQSKRLDFVYLQPGADFRGYTKVILDPAEVAFQKDWRRDYNRTTRALSSKVSDGDVQDAVRQGIAGAGDIFADALTKAGYSIVDAPGPDVLRIRVGILNIRVNAPDQQSPGRSYGFSPEAGHATLFIEARDSLTGALLGRAVDPKIVGDNMNSWRTSASNRADFRAQVKEWADASVRGIAELKSLSPINP